jgi:predicted nuclease with TOPRIM domain
MKSKQRKPVSSEDASRRSVSDSSGEARYDELLASYQELKMVCEVWVAANEAKDQRIEELEAEVEQAQQRIVRLNRLVGRQRSNEPQRRRRITEAR